MFVMGHVGCTLGVVAILVALIPGLRRRVDVRFILIGSLLPDIIDKPIGHILLASSIGYGRLLGHTLLFVLALTAIGIFMHGRRRDSALCLSFATFLHLMEDQMWNFPAVLFFPLCGFDIPHHTIYPHWYDYFLTVSISAYTPAISSVFISEMVGVFAIAVLCIVFPNILKRG